MKKLIALLFFAFFANAATAQILDTLTYLKTFEQQKAQYIGQPFYVLLNAMGQVQPTTVWGGRNIRNKNQIPYCTFYFVNPTNTFSYGVISMVIDWQTTIPLQDISYYSNRNHYYYTSEEDMFYKNKLIKDIRIFVHH